MQDYLTSVWKLSFTYAAAILNLWGGACNILPVFFLFLADAFLGHFIMLVLSTSTYSAGICLITLSSTEFIANSNSTCKQYEQNTCIGHTQKVLFYSGMALVAVGISGLQVSAEALIDQQKNNGEDVEADEYLVNVIRGYAKLIVWEIILRLIGVFVLPYIKPWAVCFGVLSICVVVSTLIFISGWGTYVKKEPQGSPLTTVCRVFVAFVAKISQPLPLDANQLYKRDEQELESLTPTLKLLEKAAIDTEPEDQDLTKNRWKLCSIEEVEDTKTSIRLIPIWMTCIVSGIVSSIGFTYFIEQAIHLNRKVGKWEVPLQVFLLFNTPVKIDLSFMLHYKHARTPSDYPPSGIAQGMILSILCCITAASIEKRRLNVIKNHGLASNLDETIPMSIRWMGPQLGLLTLADFSIKVGLQCFYINEAPASMKNYLSFFADAVFGLGYICTVLSVYVVGKISEIGGRENWFQYSLNESRLDRYYWILAVLSSVNLIVFIFVGFRYRYKKQDETEFSD